MLREVKGGGQEAQGSGHRAGLFYPMSGLS